MKYKIYVSHILITKIASTCSYSHCYIDDVANAFLFWRLFHLWVSCSCISRGADNFHLRNSLLEMIYSFICCIWRDFTKLLYLWRVYPHAITATGENCSCIPKLDVKLLIYSFFAKLFSFEYYCFFVFSTLKAKYQKINIISRRIQTYSRSKYQKTSLYRRENWGRGRKTSFFRIISSFLLFCHGQLTRT